MFLVFCNRGNRSLSSHSDPESRRRETGQEIIVIIKTVTPEGYTIHLNNNILLFVIHILYINIYIYTPVKVCIMAAAPLFDGRISLPQTQDQLGRINPMVYTPQ